MMWCLSQHIWEFQETLSVFAGSRGIYKTRNLLSMRCQDIVNRSHVSEANFSSRNVAHSWSNDDLDLSF